ncbi:hypothetical protein AKJ29_08030 [Aliiroseovarius crassostreae]|uniref:Uncharacterized protein n=2 Tax=Aliiroseovarius crassostreae TaxID=154981 RepID=A0A0P7ITN6_9RHOB|nr:hypothetical protein AKJ29_08030 [Aliiroseovarius crassostreae]
MPFRHLQFASQMPSFFQFPAVILTVAALIGCSAPSGIDIPMSPAAQHADYPRIQSLDLLLAQRTDVRTATDFAAPLASRASALRARAARLRGPIVDQATRARMMGALRRH